MIAKLSAVAILACAASACGSHPATADWQYTRWGMTPDQVAAASGGAVKALKPKVGDAKKDSSLVMEGFGRYSAGKFDFIAEFYFDRKRGGLAQVSLLFTSEGHEAVAELLQALEEKYGNWAPGTVWLDRSSAYSVQLEPSYAPGVAYLTYRPLHDKEKGGL